MTPTPLALMVSAVIAACPLNGATTIAGAGQTAAASPAAVRISNAHLVATCVAGKAAGNRERDWRLSKPTTMAFTMKNEPRPGVENHAPGIAMIEFTPEPGHKYEIEVRAEPAAFSRRVWAKGDWRPVVRDRTSDKIVSNDPRWIDSACGN